MWREDTRAARTRRDGGVPSILDEDLWILFPCMQPRPNSISHDCLVGWRLPGGARLGRAVNEKGLPEGGLRAYPGGLAVTGGIGDSGGKLCFFFCRLLPGV